MVTSLPDLIDLWPKPRVANFARDLGITVEHAAAMKRRNSIPAAHWRAVVAGAEARGIEGVTLELLADLAADGRPSPAQPLSEATP